jgi:hypothetical protein
MSYSIETRLVDKLEIRGGRLFVQLICGCRFEVGVFGADAEQVVFADHTQLTDCGRADCHLENMEELEEDAVDTEEGEPV